MVGLTSFDARNDIVMDERLFAPAQVIFDDRTQRLRLEFRIKTYFFK